MADAAGNDGSQDVPEPGDKAGELPLAPSVPEEEADRQAQQAGSAGASGAGGGAQPGTSAVTPPAPVPQQAAPDAGQRVGACHKCGAQVKDPSRVTICPTCGCRYHLFDCGGRMQTAGVTNVSDSDCPRCTKLCFCGGGTIMCHTAAQRQKRKILASMSAEKRRRQYDAEVEAPAPARSQRAAAAAAHADDYGGDDDDDGRDRPGGHSDRAAQKVLRDNTSANGQLFTLQTDLFVMKAKLARRDRDNMALQRLLQDATTVSGPPGPAAVAPGLAGLAGLPLGVTGVAMGLQGLNPIGISQIGMGVGPGAALGAAGLGPHAVLGLTPVSAARHAGDSSGRGTSETWTASDPMVYDGPGPFGPPPVPKRLMDPRLAGMDTGGYVRGRG